MPRLEIVAAAVMSLAGLAAAQPRLELSVGIGNCVSSWKDVSYSHAYTPPFLYDSTAVTSGLQTLTLGVDSIFGGSLSAAVIAGHFGVMVTYLAFNPDISGTSSADAVSVRYTAMQPPDYTPTPAALDFSTKMADPNGELRETTISLDGIFRVALPGWFSLDLSAGLTWFNIEGEIGVLDYWKFWLGGHSVLFAQQYQLLMDIESFNRIGGNAGATLNWHMATNASLWIEARYYLAGSGQADLSFEPVESESVIVAFDPETDIIPVGDLVIKPSFFRFAAGFRIVF